MFDVFVNYRTLDARYGAAAVHHFLAGRFGGTRVFLDHVSMTPGAVYPAELRAALERTRVLVVLIGPDWLARVPGTTQRLVDREDDWVRREIRRALERNIEIIPVLLDGVPLPDDLPQDITGLRLRQTAAVGHRSLAADLTRLADDIVVRVPELALPDLFVETPRLPTDPLPSELLRPEYRVVDFVPVDDQLDRLTAWLVTRPALDVRVLVGPGGRGKSRLAAEAIEYARRNGWHAGFVREDAEPGAFVQVQEIQGGLLLVVDYAEARPAQVTALVAALSDRAEGRRPARVLLLARSTGPWQRALERHQDPRVAAALSDIAVETVSRIEAGSARLTHFDNAVAAFRAALGHDHVVVGRGDLDDDRYDQVLDLHAAALATVLDATTTTTETPPAHADPVRRVLDHEERYWLRSAPGHGLPPRPERAREVVAAATLVGADGPAAARTVLGTLRSLDGAGRGVVADHLTWLTQLYPGDGALNPLRPDRLGEDLVAAVLTDYPELADDLAPVVDDQQLSRALTVLARAAGRHHAIFRGAMTDLLSVDPAGRVGVGMTVATQVDDPTLVGVLGELRGDHEFSHSIVSNLPERSLALSAFAVVHTTALLRAESRRVPMDIGFVAELRHNLAMRLTAVGENDRALSVAGEAVRDYRALAESARPEDVIELAGALTTLAALHAEVGLYGDGLPHAEEAADLMAGLTPSPRDGGGHGNLSTERSIALADAMITVADLAHEQGDTDRALDAGRRAVELARDLLADTEDPDHSNRLASALESVGGIHDSRAELGASLAATAESVEIYRALDADQPDRYRADLIRALGNLAGAHAAQGLWAEGALQGDEAVALARSLVDRHGDPHLVRLADTMNNTAALLRRLGEHDRALAFLDEVVPLYRGLSDRVPGVYLAALAGALHNLGNCLHEMGRPRDAVDSYDESIEIYRKRSGPGRDDADESLAETLVGLAQAHIALDDEDTALELVAEAIELLDHALRRNLHTTRRKLAHALHVASATAFDIGMLDRACRDAERAAALFRRVVADGPERDLRAEHAAVLHGWARALDASGESVRAAPVFEEAMDAYRALDGIEAREGLAGVLVNAAVCASERAQSDTALTLATEAVTIHRQLADLEVDTRFAFAEALNNLADLHCDRDEWPRAVEVAEEAVATAAAVHADDEPDAASLTVYALITRARAAGPGNPEETRRFMRLARDLANDDDELSELVRTWADQLGAASRDPR